MNTHSRMEESCSYSLDLVVTSLIDLTLYLYSEISEPNSHLLITWNSTVHQADYYGSKMLD